MVLIAQFPHCDQRVLHAPSGYNDDGALISQDGERWLLAILRTDEAPWSRNRARISPGSLARTDTPRFAIRLTQPAWSVLLSKATTTGLSSFRTSQQRVSVEGVELIIVRAAAQRASALGELHTRTQWSSDVHTPYGSENEQPLFGNSYGTPSHTRALIAEPVSLGTSWSLTIETDGVTRTLQLPASVVVDDLRQSSLSWLSAIWYVLTAIAPELTSEQWQQERERLRRGECEYCDAHPEWQELRDAWCIAFTGHEPAERVWSKELPCPADFNRPPGSSSDHRRWGGNKPTSAHGDASWPVESFASHMLYGDQGGRRPWPWRERLIGRALLPWRELRMRMCGFRRDGPFWRYP